MAARLSPDARSLCATIREALTEANDNLDSDDLAAFSVWLRNAVEEWRAVYRDARKPSSPPDDE